MMSDKTMDPVLVERVARAIAGQCASYAYDKLSVRGREHCLDAAKAAIEIIRERVNDPNVGSF